FAFGLGNSLYFPARVGAASVLVPERIDAEGAFDVIARERPTVFFTVPTLYARMLAVDDAEHRWDLSSLRFCVSSGEALPPAIFDAWAERFGLELVEVLGSTEALHDFIANAPGAARRGSVGRLVPGFEARLVDDAGSRGHADRVRRPPCRRPPRADDRRVRRRAAEDGDGKSPALPAEAALACASSSSACRRSTPTAPATPCVRSTVSISSSTPRSSSPCSGRRAAASRRC